MHRGLLKIPWRGRLQRNEPNVLSRLEETFIFTFIKKYVLNVFQALVRVVVVKTYPVKSCYVALNEIVGAKEVIVKDIETKIISYNTLLLRPFHETFVNLKLLEIHMRLNLFNGPNKWEPDNETEL